MTPLGSQTISGNRLPWSGLTHLSVHMRRCHLNRPPQVHSAVHVFILVLFPAQNVPHSKFSNLIHPPTTSSDSLAPRSLCKWRPPPAAYGVPHGAQRTRDRLVTEHLVLILRLLFWTVIYILLGAYLAWYFPLHNLRFDEVKVVEFLDQ